MQRPAFFHPDWSLHQPGRPRSHTQLEGEENVSAAHGGISVQTDILHFFFHLAPFQGAPSHRLLPLTKELFPAPLCSNAASKRKRKYRNTCRCAAGEDAVEVAPDGKIRGNCTG